MKIDPADLDRSRSHELLMSAILPRPIAFVSTVGGDGIFNLAPYSCYTPLSLKPALICLHIGWKRDGRKKDTLRNIEFSKELVISVVTEDLAKAMNQASAEYPSHVDEFKEVGLAPGRAELVKAPLVTESPVNMECKLIQIQELGKATTGGHLIISELALTHVRDEFWEGDQIDSSR